MAVRHYIQERDVAFFVEDVSREFKEIDFKIRLCSLPEPCFLGSLCGGERKYTHALIAEHPDITIELAKGVVNEGIYEFDVNTQIPSNLWDRLDKLAFSYL